MPKATKYNSKWEKLPECEGWLTALKLKDDSYSTERAKCIWCDCDFSISHGGLNDVKRHAKTKNHLEFVKAKFSTKSVPAFLFENNEKSLNAAKEATQVYHMVKHNQSFKSMSCTSKVLRYVFDANEFACSATKSMAIVTGVFEPMILNQIQAELKQTMFACLSTDTSSRNEITMYPVIARYFLPLEGIIIRLLDFGNSHSEKGVDIFGVLQATWQTYNIRDKISGFCGDNCRTLFGLFQLDQK